MSIAPQKEHPKFATFWHGPELSPYDLACLSSFVKRGYQVSVYSYEKVSNLPSWVVAKDASQILPPGSLHKFVVNGKSSLAHFSDHFRFAMFLKTDEVWIDTDIILLRDFDLDVSGNLMGFEDPGRICTAVLRLDKNDPRTKLCLSRVDAMVGAPIKWGDTGPRLLTSVYAAGGAMPQSVFYPVHYNSFYKVFVPELAGECAQLCSGSYTLHLWNHIVLEMGLYNRIGPPRGSYLYELFESFGATEFFPDFYPASVIKHMVSNVTERPSKHAGVMTVLRLLPCAIKLAIMRRLGRVW